jgi:dihydroxyacetone kinase-like protein
VLTQPIPAPFYTLFGKSARVDAQRHSGDSGSQQLPSCTTAAFLDNGNRNRITEIVMIQFTKTLLQKMLQAALAAVENQQAMLNRLDAVTGDGDHGTAIVAAMKAATAAALKEGTLKTTLETIGWDVMSNTSGSTSALMGSFFIGMSHAVVGEELDGVQTITMFESGLANVRTSSRANVGDKTLMDALIPAIATMTALKEQSPPLADLFVAAAESAQKGADSTENLVAKFGRAKNLGERSRGSLDAGAVSTALIYRAYAAAVKDW